MSIRAAKFDDHWRKVFSRAYAYQYRALEFSGLKPLRDGTVTFSPGITAIVGGNGVGKTTLAHAVADVLAGEAGVAALRDNQARLDGCSLCATLEFDDGKVQLKPTLRINGEAREADDKQHRAPYIWLDSSSVATLTQKQVLDDGEFADLLEGLMPKAISADELAFASYLVGKEYSECKIWEIADYGPFDVWPYFQVVSNGVTYRSENMGQGELSLLVAIWAIARADKGAVVVLEEPETHISARSQSALMDAIAWACATKGLWVIITTHSPVVLQRLPSTHRRLLVNEAGRSRLIENPRLHSVAAVVGGGAAFKCLLVLEDECARYFVQYLLEEIDSDLARQCSYVYVDDGESQITQALKSLPAAKEWMSIVGCYDGDMRGKIPGGLNWPVVFLPGNAAPDLLLKSCFQGSTVEELAAELQMELEPVTVSLANVVGTDHHDWLTALTRELNRTLGEVVRAGIRVWLRSEQASAEAFLNDLKSVFR